METVESGKYISVKYTGTLDNGDVFDSNVDRLPMEVHIGAGQLIPGFESQLMGMSLNEKKKFTVPSDEAYGPKDDRMMQSVPRSEVPKDMDIYIGMVVGFMTPDGHKIPARIVQLDDEQLTMDMNHPLAGESLTFDIEVVGISDTPTQKYEGCSSGGCDSGSCDSGSCDCSGGSCG